MDDVESQPLLRGGLTRARYMSTSSFKGVAEGIQHLRETAMRQRSASVGSANGLAPTGHAAIVNPLRDVSIFSYFTVNFLSQALCTCN